MPYRIRWEGHGVYRRFFGVITLAEFREANKEMRSDVRYSGIRYIISDYLEAQPAPDVTEQDLRAYAERERLYYYSSPDIVQAIVATDPKNVQSVRYYESLGVSPYCLADFATVDDARHWIASNPRLSLSRSPLNFTSGGTEGALLGRRDGSAITASAQILPRTDGRPPASVPTDMARPAR